MGGASFVGELRHRRWRYATEIVLAAMLIALGIDLLALKPWRGSPRARARRR